MVDLDEHLAMQDLWVREDGVHRVDRCAGHTIGVQKLDPLFLHIEPNWSSVGARPIELSEPLDVETSILEYMEQTKDKRAAQVKMMMPRFFGGAD